MRHGAPWMIRKHRYIWGYKRTLIDGTNALLPALYYATGQVTEYFGGRVLGSLAKRYRRFLSFIDILTTLHVAQHNNHACPATSPATA